MSKAPSTSKLRSKASTTSLQKAETPTKSKEEKVEPLNGHSNNDKENIENVITTNEDMTGEDKLVQESGDANAAPGDSIENIETSNGPIVKGLQEVTQSEC